MDTRTLKRIGRVRALQLTLAQGQEALARDKADTEAALGRRIAALADAVAPTPTTATALSMGAEAQYRERLHQSAQAAAMRLQNAQTVAARAAAATRAARQDQGAVDKLLQRARAEDIRREMRALEDMPSVAKVRHESC